MSELTVGELRFEVRLSDRRKTLQITVDRDGGLILSAPTDVPDSALDAFVRDKRFWVYTKLAETEELRRTAPAEEYRSGEGFPYLGRNYRLLLVSEQEAPVKLEHGRFKMRRDFATDGRSHMVRWYADHARPWLTKRTRHVAQRVRVEPADVVVQDLGYRWGSCGKGGSLYFHWKSILLPPPIVDYILTHELVHLHEAHHTPDFWRRLERAMPDFAARKQWLAENAAGVISV